MNTNEIVQKAKERLTEIEVEAGKLRALVAAAEGSPVVAPPPPVFLPVPYVVPSRTSCPFSPDYVHESLRWLRLDDVTCSGGPLGQPADFTLTIEPASALIGRVPFEASGTFFGPGPSIDNKTCYGSH